MDQVNKITTDVLIVGGGLAGILAGIRAAEAGVSVTIVDKATVGKCGQSAFAAGDYDLYYPGEDYDSLLNIYLEGSNLPGLVSPKLTREHLDQSLERVLELEQWGVRFKKDEAGHLLIKFGPGGKRRVVGRADLVMEKLRQVAVAKGTSIINRVYISDLLTRDHAVTGAVGFNVVTGEQFVFYAKSVIMAAASYGLKCNNFQGVGFLAGDSLAIAWRAGAELYNVEFLRGNTGHRDYNTVGMARFSGDFGGKFVNAMGEAFMQKYNPDSSNPNSAVYHRFWLAMAMEAKAGRAPIYFDLTGISAENYLLSRELLPHLFKVLDQAGVDIRKEKMPWVPVGYRGLGGLVHDYDFQATLSGLFVAGDNSGSATLAWALFSGHKAGKAAGRFALEAPNPMQEYEQARGLLSEAMAPLDRGGPVTAREVICGIQAIMVPYPVLILRSESSLTIALQQISAIMEAVAAITAADPHELLKANEARSMALTTELHLQAALQRQESRGYHYREDYPQRKDRDWRKWITVKQEGGQVHFATREVLP